MKLALTILLLAVPTYAQERFDVCSVVTSAWNRAERKGTSNTLLGEFRTPVSDETTNKSIKHEETGLMVNASVKYVALDSTLKSQPEIRIAISVSETEKDAFDVVDNAVAGTVYKKNWGSLFVAKQLVVGDIEHRFTLSCSESIRKRKK